MGILGGLFGDSTEDKSAPLSLSFKSVLGPSISEGPLAVPLPSPPDLALGIDGLLLSGASLKTMSSYSFERNILAPGTPFRFTAPGVDKDLRLSIRSGDTVQILVTDRSGKQIPIATGFIDETDTHISSGIVEYVLTGRDTLGQLIDNAAIDAQNRIINLKNTTLDRIFQSLILNTRMPQEFQRQNIDDGPLLFQTNVGETKMNALQRYLEFTNCLVWTKPNGQAVLGKPNFLAIPPDGVLSVGTVGEESPSLPSLYGVTPQVTNVLDCRVKRNLNNAIRQIVNQMQNLKLVDAGAYTIQNQDEDMQEVASALVGRSVYRSFTFGQGAGAVNVLSHVGNMPGAPSQVGQAYSLREMARDNVQVLEIEMTLQGHLNSNGNPYDVDQVYYCNIPDEEVADNFYVYAITYELTLDHGMMTKLKLCKLGTLVAGAIQVPQGLSP